MGFTDVVKGIRAEEKAKERRFTHYLKSDGRYVLSNEGPKTTEMRPGVYTINATMDGTLYFENFDVVMDEVIHLPGSTTQELTADIMKFFQGDVKAKFDKYGLVYKRGILLHGRPGTAKTTTLASIAKRVITEMDAIVLFNPDPHLLPIGLKSIREVEGEDKKVVVLYEEFDSILNRNEALLLSILDGELQIANIVYLATTNYISRIPSRIKNRPSRFARVVEMKEPDEAARRAFFTAKLQGDDVKHLESMITFSEGLVIDQMKDLIISVCCFDVPISEAILKIKEMESSHDVGIDDYNEENANEYFKRSKGDKNKGKNKPPLKPL